MAITKTTQVARAIIEERKKGGMLFNDKLKDGRRSLKVWGWSSSEYLEAKRRLEAMGCEVFVMQTPVFYDCRGGTRTSNTRLHIAE